MDAYSYTTVRVEQDGTALTSVSLHPDERVSVLYPRGTNRAQISITHAYAHVRIVPTNATAPTAEDVRVARKLAESFVAYAAEVERLHALANPRSESAEDPAA
ncbi:hypothetical protein BZB76_1038 [Actinomadura pelletieri DSM 43383]|uniref:Uncharacterized protein n=1 Tax=Actinomadura pelletieri DSM 43383 TaxID=1120940 RepID=A0A495R0D8_9ACTN|nr:hypothetical protein [Actinomadura pelletieri]RKS79566.1 hypothetical protein BZB76_1038 [Actinomadura pelletieri DSM 43383]